MAANDGNAWPAGWVITGSIALVLAVGTVIWFLIPDLSANHKFISPSGRVTIEIGEFCEERCNRSIVAETAGNGSPVRRGCLFDLPQTHPVLLNAYPLWAADERSVEIVYADAEGQGGKFALDIARDCTLTE